MKPEIIKILSDAHQKEYNALYEQVEMYRKQRVKWIFEVAFVSRLSWLEYQAKIKIDSILELCRTGK